jgi:hypothetical protein
MCCTSGTVSASVGNTIATAGKTDVILTIQDVSKKPADTIICIILLLTSISMSVLLILLLGFKNTF